MDMFGSTDLDQFLISSSGGPVCIYNYLGRMSICPAVSKCEVHILNSEVELHRRIHVRGAML